MFHTRLKVTKVTWINESNLITKDCDCVKQNTWLKVAGSECTNTSWTSNTRHGSE